MAVEQKVTGHYTPEKLEEKILRALEGAGKNPASLNSDDLVALDNLHVGGREATQALAGFLRLRPGMRLLDVGSGLGGPARYFAEQGFDVTGLDLTEELVHTAAGLTRRLRLDHKAKFRQGSALQMPFDSGTFDAAYMIHVGMNIQDKSGVFREVARVLKREGRFAIFDIMGQEGSFEFPQPWARSSETSFVAPLEDYLSALAAAGFRIDHQRDRRQFALEFMKRMRDRAASGPAPVLGVHVVMGEQAPLMLNNVAAAVASGALTPMELVASRS